MTGLSETLELCKKLKDKGILRLGLASSSHLVLIEAVLKRLGNVNYTM